MSWQRVLGAAAAPDGGGISDWLSDTSDDVLKRIAAGTVEANQWMMLKAIDLINGGLRINLGSSWLQEVLATMRYLVLPVVGILFVLQVITAMVGRSPSGLWRAVWGSAVGLILGTGCAVLTAGLLLIVDQASAHVLGDAQTAAQDGIKKAFAMDGSIEGTGWLVVTVIAALGILAWATVIVVLFLRKAVVIATVVFGPFAMAGLASGKTKSWAVRWAEVVFALALSKFVICVILTLAYSAVAASITGDITDALLGSVWVLLAALSPLAVLRFVHFAGDQISSANVSGAAGAVGNARQAAGLGIAGAGAAGGMAGGAAGWLAGQTNAASLKPSKPLSPSSAVGGRSTGPAAGGGGPAGAAGGGPAGVAGGGSAGAPGGGSAGAPGGGPTGPSPVGPVGGGDPGPLAADLAPAPASASPVAAAGTAQQLGGSAEQPDPAVQPSMDGFVSAAAAGSRSAVVTPSAAAAQLGVPHTQADRMFMQYESQGVLGPQQHGGARRVLAAPSTVDQGVKV